MIFEVDFMRRYFGIICLLIAQLIGWAQMEVREGYCVTPSSDTLYGKFQISVDVDEKINLARVQWKVYFFDEMGKLIVFKPGELNSFFIKDSLENYHFHSIELYPNNYTFIRLLSDGYLRLYVHYTEILAGGWDHINFTNNFLTYPKRSEEDYFIVQKSGEDVIRVQRFSMYRKLSEYISENADLASSIRKKEYVYTDIYRIVREYNEWYSENRSITSSENKQAGERELIN
jgi:hypothetical protein